MRAIVLMAALGGAACGGPARDAAAPVANQGGVDRGRITGPHARVEDIAVVGAGATWYPRTGETGPWLDSMLVSDADARTCAIAVRAATGWYVGEPYPCARDDLMVASMDYLWSCAVVDGAPRCP